MIQTKELSQYSYRGPKPPSYLSDLLTRIGGTNHYDEPHFRLVWAQDRKTPSGGVWIDWLPGTSLKDRNQSKGRKPWRRSLEVRMIPRYGPAIGWALERWVPAKAYGSREKWYAPSVIGGTMILADPQGVQRIPSQGSYPSRGDYEYTGFLYQTGDLSEATVVTAVQALIRDRELMPQDPARRIALRTMIANEAAKEADRLYEQWALDIIENAQPAFKGQLMSGFGKKGKSSMQAIADKLRFGQV